ncbi:MAG: BACON domain-containing protein [Limisphaerales bacterium]
MAVKKIHLVIAVAGAMALSAMPVETYAQLLAGTGGSGGGMVYAYQGGTNWTAISPSLGSAVLDIIEFKGTLYAATMSYSLGGEVWRYDGGTSWTVVGDNMDNEVCALEIYNGQLYAGTAENGGNLYLYNGTNFVYVGAVANFSGIRAMHSSSYGYLQLGEIDSDMFGRYDGNNFYYDTNFAKSCIVNFAEYNNKLYAAGEEPADLFGSTNGINWSLVLSYNSAYALWGMEPFQGQLYLGYSDGTLAYIDSSEAWHSVLTVSDSIISMVAGGNTMLYFGTGAGAVGVATGSGPGYVYAYTGNGATDATLISGPLGTGVQCLYYPPDPLLITPVAGFDASVYVGGPFSITNETFTLTNTGTNSLDWSLTNTSSWLDASPGGGTLPVGGTTNVTVSLNSNAYSLTSGIYTVTVWFADLNDGVVQSRQFTLTVIGPPVITCPGNITVTTTNSGGAVVNYNVTVSDGCPPITTNCVPPSGSVFPIGATTVNCSATDSCGQSNSCSFTVTVLPLLSITCPGNITVTTTNPDGAVVNYTVTVSGGCPPITTNCVPPSGSVFPIGTTTVNCSATDSCGQSASCSFTVGVDALLITPGTGLTAASGCVGGPFSITNETFSLTNIGTAPLNWSLANTSLWLDASPSGGELTPGGGADTVTVSLNSNAYSLTQGNYSATVWFTNLSGGVGQSRQFSLTIGLPIITAEPTNQTVMAGGTATFSVTVSATCPSTDNTNQSTYQWQLNGTNLLNGIITTAAGNGINGYSGDYGQATNASLSLSADADPFAPSGVALDASGNLFIADVDNGRVRKVDNNGIITTVAGGGHYGLGDGGAATSASLIGPSGVAVDASGNLFIADTWNNRIREVDPDGIITTVAGNGSLNYSGDGGQATSASLAGPSGVAVDASGNLFIADTGNFRIREVLLFASQSTLTLCNITTNNAGNYTVIITNFYGSVTSSVASLMVRAEDLQITPATGFTASGYVGGPFSITNESFSLTNTGTNSLNWTLVNTSVWLNASPGGGTLPVGGTTNVTVSLNSNNYPLTSGIYTATVWFTNLNDKVGQSCQFILIVTVVPNIAIQKATPGMRIFAKSTVSYTRDEVGTFNPYVSWYGGPFPVSYSFTLANMPPLSAAMQEQIFLIPVNSLPYAPYNNPFADYDATNCFGLLINATASNYSATVTYKVNAPNAALPIAANNLVTNYGSSTSTGSATGNGTWTLTFTSDTTGWVTGPGLSPVNFNIPAGVSAQFANPLVACFGIQPNSAIGIGQYVDFLNITITNGYGFVLNDNFASGMGNWTVLGGDAGGVWDVTPDSAYWLNWINSAGYDVEVNSDLTAANNWINPAFYDGNPTGYPGMGYDNGLLTETWEGTKIWTLISTNDWLGGATRAFFRLSNSPIY